MAGHRLPVEVLEKLFSFLDKEEVVSCSGVNGRWNETAKRRLARKYGIQLCRRLDRISSKSRDVCLAGDQAVQNFAKRKLRKLQTLRIQYDEASVLGNSLATIFVSCKNLKRLELLNLTFISENDVNVILERCNPGFQLRISVRDRQKSKVALTTLQDHRELFHEILVEYDLNCIEGWFPIPLRNSKFTIPEMSSTVSLECLGLKEIECFNLNKLRTIRLEKCFDLSETSVHSISKLNVTTVSISGCSASESTWLNCFKFGFQNLETVDITGCQNVTPAVIEVLGKKNLINIKLEINKNVEASGLPHLYKLSRLESLHITTDQITSNCIQEGIENHWLNLKCLQIEESPLTYRENLGNIETVESLSKIKGIKFIYRKTQTKIIEISCIKSSFQI